MKKKLLIIAFLLESSLVPVFCQGLKFHGLETIISERTSYDVFSKSPQRFNDKLSISFQMATYPTSRFGYILRIHDENTSSRILNLSYDAKGEKVVFRINEEGKRSIIYAEIEKNDYPEFVWQNISLQFNFIDNTILLQVGKNKYSASFDSETNSIKPHLFFGKSEHVVDVPSYAIRNLVISDEVKTFIFPLNESEGEKVHDSNGRVRGTVSNPDWLISKSSHWHKESSIQINSPADVFYDEKNKTVGMLTETDLLTYNVTNSTTNEIHIQDTCPVNILLGNNFVRDEKVYIYELNNFKGIQKNHTIACFDLQTNKWSPIGNCHLNSPQHHHGAFFNTATGEYTFFGGFGAGMYNGDFYALGEDGQWHIKWGDQRQSRKLFPRFFAAAGTDNGKECAYIFGGMGNESGEQVVGRRYFYDFHRIDFRTGKCDLLWEIHPEGDNFVPARNLIVDGDYFYVLCYPEYLTNSTMHLYKFRIADGSYEIMADGIDIVSDKIWSSSSLYLDRELGEFVVTTLNVDDSLKPDVSIHSLMYPPVSANDLKKQDGQKNVILGIIILTVTLSLGLIIFFFIKISVRKKETKYYIKAKQDPKTRIFRTHQMPNSIYLFGQFTVMDRDGNDITDIFGNQQKTLLCLMLKYHENGLSSSRMASLLWPDKEENKAKNSRGVAINGLRKSLSTLDGISIDYEDGIYRIVTGENFYCDLLSFSSRIKTGDNNGIISILSRGKFLKDISDPTFDSFKARIEDESSTMLSEELSKHFLHREYRATIEIGDIIQQYDPLDEQALHFIVHSLLAIKRRDDALVRYSAFTTEYQNTNGEPYPKRFDNV